MNPVRIVTIDAHAEGGPLRLIVRGFPSLGGATMPEKQAWAANHADHLRRLALLEPRGHADLRGAVLTEPVRPGSHAGIVFMHTGGYAPMSGHGIIAATTIALERGLLMPGGDAATVVFDTVAGTVRARALLEPSAAGPPPAVRVRAVSVEHVPAFVLQAGVPVAIGSRQLRADVAFGGAFYAIVDSEAAGVGVDPRNAPELRRAGMAIAAAATTALLAWHPENPAVDGVFGTIFTGPPTAAGADLRSVTVYGDGRIERSPGGTGTAALLAVVAAMGLADEDGRFVHEGLAGTTLRGRLLGRTEVGEHAAVVCEVTGSAWLTGDHTFIAHQADPLRDGFRV